MEEEYTMDAIILATVVAEAPLVIAYIRLLQERGVVSPKVVLVEIPQRETSPGECPQD
jgi:hypothetical protein